MITPLAMTWDEAVAASDEILIAAYMSDGFARDEAEAAAAELRAASGVAPADQA